MSFLFFLFELKSNVQHTVFPNKAHQQTSLWSWLGGPTAHWPGGPSDLVFVSQQLGAEIGPRCTRVGFWIKQAMSQNLQIEKYPAFLRLQLNKMSDLFEKMFNVDF